MFLNRKEDIEVLKEKFKVFEMQYEKWKMKMDANMKEIFSFMNEFEEESEEEEEEMVV